MSELFSLFYVVIPFSVYHRLSSLHFRVNSLSAWTEKISHQLFRVVWKLIKSTAAGTLDSFFFLLNLQSLKHYLKILSSQIHICFLPQWFVYSVLCGGLVPQAQERSVPCWFGCRGPVRAGWRAGFQHSQLWREMYRTSASHLMGKCCHA